MISESESNVTYIESLRGNDLTKIAFELFLPNNKNKIIHMEHNTIVAQLSERVLSFIETFENAKGIVPNSFEAFNLTILIFIAIENYLLDIVRIIENYSNVTVEKIEKKNIHQRISFLLDELQYDKRNFVGSVLYKQIKEFNEFRNAAFHSASLMSKQKYRNTLFSPIPIEANLVDLVQALDIFVNTVGMLRGIFLQFDLMPQVNIYNGLTKSFKFIKFDSLYYEVILPSFYTVLKKHNLTTKFIPAVSFCYIGKTFLPMKPYIRIQPDKKFALDEQTPQTKLALHRYMNFIIKETHELPPDSLQLGNNYKEHFQKQLNLDTN